MRLPDLDYDLERRMAAHRDRAGLSAPLGHGPLQPFVLLARQVVLPPRRAGHCAAMGDQREPLRKRIVFAVRKMMSRSRKTDWCLM